MDKKILGCILGAATGDAMGAATEGKSEQQICKVFQGRVTTMRKPDSESVVRGRRAGQITDAFSIPYYLTMQLIRAGGRASRKVGEEALKEWGDSEYFELFAGMTTRNVVNRLKNHDKMTLWSYSGQLGSKLYKGHYYALSSNGAAVKAYPAGILNRGNIRGAVEDTVELTMASHDDPYSISGACAVAAAVCEAMEENTSVYRIMQAALWGSETGEELARKRKDIWVYPGPSVTKRMKMAEKIALCGESHRQIVDELRDCIGLGPAIAETVPTAMGLMIANGGKVMDTIIDAVNIGDETCATACVAGAVTGAYCGSDQIPREYLTMIERENQISIMGQAAELEKLCQNIM